jgi:hypothetical protein
MDLDISGFSLALARVFFGTVMGWGTIRICIFPVKKMGVERGMGSTRPSTATYGILYSCVSERVRRRRRAVWVAGWARPVKGILS